MGVKLHGDSIGDTNGSLPTEAMIRGLHYDEGICNSLAVKCRWAF